MRQAFAAHPPLMPRKRVLYSWRVPVMAAVQSFQ